MSDLTERLRRLMTNAPSCTNARIAAFEAADALEAAEADLARLEHQLQQAEEATSAAYKDAEAAEAKLAAIDALCDIAMNPVGYGTYFAQQVKAVLHPEEGK